MAYVGSYAILTDIGSMTKVLEAAYPDKFGTYASKIQNTLDDIIVAAYGSKRGTSYTGSFGGFGDSDDGDIDLSDPSIWDDDDDGEDYEGGEEAAWETITDKQMYYKGGIDYLTNGRVPVEWSEPFYGLTIVTQSVSVMDTTILSSYNAQTGYSSKWGDVIEAWFKTTYNESDYE